jgi:hypothetical protein
MQSFLLISKLEIARIHFLAEISGYYEDITFLIANRQIIISIFDQRFEKSRLAHVEMVFLSFGSKHNALERVRM